MGAKLHVKFSAMNAGKSLDLLRAAYNYEEAGAQVLLFASALDDRYGVGRITSRVGLTKEAELYDATTDFDARLAQCKDISCVFVDEAQFLTPAQVMQIHRAVHCYNLPVILYLIRSDFMGNPFPGAAAAMALAEEIEELKAVCGCDAHRRATMQIRLSDDGTRVSTGEQVLIGGNAQYRQVCAKCFYK